MLIASRISSISGPRVRWSEWVEFKDKSLVKKYGDWRMPTEVVLEHYFAQKIDFKKLPKEIFSNKEKIFRMCFTFAHVKFLCGKLLPQGVWHSQTMDIDEVAQCYDNNNEFYRTFLGPMMIYTCAIFKDYSESLEDAQRNKLDIVCRKLQLKEGDRHLDLGCGWGSLAIHAAKYFKTKSTGITIAKDQVAWAKGKAKEAGVDDAKFIVTDYRDIPVQTFDKISCLEMAEHVGVKKFPAFMKQVYDMLEDDGLFYLQIAGLRRCWQYEDLIWGIFMGTYIFPAADASCPLAWVVNQLEVAGFEVASHENIGIQYSETISRWCDNFVSNKARVVEIVGERWYRVFEVFLGWSTLIAQQGGSTAHMLVCHKNQNKFDRRRFVGTLDCPPVTSNAGCSPNPTLFKSDSYGSR